MRIDGLSNKKYMMNLDTLSKDIIELLSYRYLLLLNMSSRCMGTTKKLLSEQINWEEVVEFRCFDESGEIHGIRNCDHFVCFEIREEKEIPQEYVIRKEYPLAANVMKDEADGKNILVENGIGDADKLMVVRYLDYDEDGQAEIILSRLYGFTKEGGR